jgi:hypothetical protein
LSGLWRHARLGADFRPSPAADAFLRIIRAVMLKGADLPAVATEFGWLVVFVALFAGVALVRFRRTLD